jgi:hypothetical protein
MALRMLNMEIWGFSPDLLSLLANEMPHLRSLKLEVQVFGPAKQLKSDRRNRVPEVSRRSYVLSALQHIIIP